jgi:hypothetical protein
MNHKNRNLQESMGVEGNSEFQGDFKFISVGVGPSDFWLVKLECKQSNNLSGNN